MSSTGKQISTIIRRLGIAVLVGSMPAYTQAAKPTYKAPTVIADKAISSAAIMLKTKPELLTSLDTVLSDDAFTRSLATITMLEAPYSRTLLASLAASGSSDPQVQMAKWIAETMWDGAKILTGFSCIIPACRGAYLESRKLHPGSMHAFAGVTLLGICLIADGTRGLVASHKNDSRLHAIMHDVALFHTKTQELAAILAQHPELQTALPETAALATPINTDSENAQALTALLQTSTLQNKPSALSMHGRVRAAYALIMQTQAQFAQCYAAVQELSAAVAQAKMPQN